MEKISRRKFLYMGAATTAGAVVAACAPQTVIVEKEKVVKETVVVTEEKVVEKEVTKEVVKEVTREVEVEKLITPTALPSMFTESPVTAQLVADGKLPNVDERLPSEPLVVFPYESIGTYGGQLRAGSLSTAFYGGDPSLYMAHQSLLRLTPNLREAVPNIFKDWSVSDDFTEITLFFRRGMKWSDGEPCNADSWMWWWEDHSLNEDITPVIGQWFRVGGEPMAVTKVDDYTVRLKFAAPNPSFVLVNLAHRYGFWSDNLLPGHYLREFHINYNPRAQELAEAAEYDFWYQYYGNRRNVNQNLDVPILRSHDAVDESPERVLFTRNPYFFITDTEGNQLPYIDEAIHDRVADLSLLNAKIVGGQYDFSGFDTNIQNYSTYADAADQGNYQILLWRSGKGSDVVYQVNCNWGQDVGADPDPQKDMMREIFLDDRFRQALSLAINRDEVNEVLYFGNGTPRQMTVIPDSRHFKDEYATAWADYDPDQANAFLDELGLSGTPTRPAAPGPTAAT
jgi:peptide/nickel transport system substrate-binding protein